MTVPPGWATAIAEDGYAVAERVLDPIEVDEARGALDDIFDAEADIASARGWLTDSYRVAYALPTKARHFIDVCGHPLVLALARDVLGDDCRVASGNGFDLVPHGSGQPLHRDHPHPTPGTTCYLHIIIALDAFTVDNGTTRVVPASHRGAGALAEPAGCEERAVSVEVPLGGAIAFDGALVHGAGPNRTGQRRRALHLFFCRPWVVPHWDFAASFPEELRSTLSDAERNLFGFTTGLRRFDHVERRVRR